MMKDNKTSKKKLNYLQIGAIIVILTLVAGIFVYKNFIGKATNISNVSVETKESKKLHLNVNVDMNLLT
jgi:hypothetical protein